MGKFKCTSHANAFVGLTVTPPPFLSSYKTNPPPSHSKRHQTCPEGVTEAFVQLWGAGGGGGNGDSGGGGK